MITFENNMDLVFHALAHKIRRLILNIVREKSGLSVGELTTNFDLCRIAIMNPLAVRSEAGLIISEKCGRSWLLYLNIVPIKKSMNVGLISTALTGQIGR